MIQRFFFLSSFEKGNVIAMTFTVLPHVELKVQSSNFQIEFTDINLFDYDKIAEGNGAQSIYRC